MSSPIFGEAAGTWREVRRAYGDHLEAQFKAAEDATRGNLLSARGRSAGIDAFSLFSGPDIRARAYASPELLEFWQTHARVTFEQFEREAVEHAGHACPSCGYRGAA